MSIRESESVANLADTAATVDGAGHSAAIGMAHGRYDSGKDFAGKDVADDYDEKPAPRRWSRQWFFATRARRLAICCLVMGVVIAAIMIPVAIFVIAPKIAQSLITGSTLQFISSDIMDPREDGFTLRVVGKIENTGFLPAHIVVPDPVQVSWQGQNMISLPLDPIDATPGVGATINSTVDAKILDATAFATFAKQMLLVESFDWRLQAMVSATALGITFNNLLLDKTVTLKGFNGLNNVTILSFDLPSSDPTAGIILNIRADLFNPSPIGVDMGDISFNVSLNGSTIGTSSAKGVTVKAGDNLLAMNGNIIPVTSALQGDTLTEMFNFFLAGQASSLLVIGTDVRPSNASKAPISWLRGAFVGLPLTVTLPAQNKIQVITGIDLNQFAISFDPANPWVPKMSSPGIVAHIQMPFTFPISIGRVNMNINMLSNTNATIATIGTGWIPATTQFNGTSGKMMVDLNQAPVNVPQNQQTAFGELMKTIFLGKGTVAVPVLVQSDAVASTAAGNITIAKLPYNNNLPLLGIQGLAAVPPSIDSLTISGGTDTYIDMVIVTKMTNPSNVQMMLNSDVNLDLAYNGQIVGNIVIPNMTLNVGPNTVTANARYFPQTPEARAAGAQLLTAFVNGDTSNTVIQGSTKSSPLTPLIPALSAVSLPVALPGMNIKPGLLTGIQTTTFSIAFDPANPWAPKMSSPNMVASLKLPFAVPITAKSASMAISMLSGTTTIATINTGSLPVTSAISGLTGTMSLDLNGATLNVPQAQQPAFAELMRSIFFGTGAVGIPVSVLADAVTVVAGGDITLTQVPFSTSLALQGLQGLAASPLAIQTFSITGGTPQYISITISVKMVNPSNVQLALNSDVTLNMVYQNQVLGTVTIPNMSLNIGDNTVSASARYSPQTPQAAAVGSQLLTAFVGGTDTVVQVQGSTTATPLGPLIPSLSALTLSTTFPSIKTPLMTQARFALTLTTLFDNIAHANFDASNPTGAPLTITHVTAQLFQGTNQLGTMDADTNIVVPAGGSVTSSTVNLKIQISIPAIQAIFSALGNNLKANVVASRLSVKVGDYGPIDLTYTQNDVPTSFVLTGL
ncbi:hypothetical protein M427DRAFT_41124 [Gonapodya prolifera JEL478]|uniref:Pre-rRNA processing protein n=1 Tax=Gonapodya prolifera (strain JEL478) TaxID=1344416 RepID=A0A139AW55_GONPJ|nr:hypothetical protein M427DRAFT_41124 [Gonapodya prolifera JEL478]|eukprot:KXS20958.1 hypothetical protein M427DRAFT_41124 [Gonapodya prolifera JEL478]